MLNAVSTVESQEIEGIEPVNLDQKRGTASKEIISSANAQNRSIKAMQASQTEIEYVAQAMEKYVNSMQRDLQIQVHQGTGSIMVKVISKETGKVIREVPPEELLNLAARMEQMMGVLFNGKV